MKSQAPFPWLVETVWLRVNVSGTSKQHVFTSLVPSQQLGSSAMIATVCVLVYLIMAQEEMESRESGDSSYCEYKVCSLMASMNVD